MNGNANGIGLENTKQFVIKTKAREGNKIKNNNKNEKCFLQERMSLY